MRAASALFLALAFTSGAARADRIRVGAAMTGSLAWEIAAMALEPNAPHQVVLKSFAGPAATKVALASGAVDVILADWIWTARMRDKGEDLVFAPASRALGALLAREDQGVSRLSDLAGRRIGVAGGPLDKSWLLLRSLAAEQGVDIDSSHIVFGAPALLDQQFLAGHLDALLTYWNHAAELQETGGRKVMRVSDMMRALGLDPEVPILGIAINGAFAQQHREALNWFLGAYFAAKQRLASCGALWKQVVLLKHKSERVMRALCQEYGTGIVDPLARIKRSEADKVLAVLGRAAAPARIAPIRVPDGLFLSDHAP